MENVQEVDNVDMLLNPEIRQLSLGIKEPEVINIYPLTFYDQKIIGGKVITDIQGLTKLEEDGENALTEAEYVKYLFKVLEENLPKLITKCTEKTEKQFMSAASTGQIVNFISIILEVNFLHPAKKGMGLLQEMGNIANQSE